MFNDVKYFSLDFICNSLAAIVALLWALPFILLFDSSVTALLNPEHKFLGLAWLDLSVAVVAAFLSIWVVFVIHGVLSSRLFVSCRRPLFVYSVRDFDFPHLRESGVRGVLFKEM